MVALLALVVTSVVALWPEISWPPTARGRDATVVTTAAALKDAEEARRGRSESAWSPWTKVFAVIAAVATVAGVYLALVAR